MIHHERIVLAAIAALWMWTGSARAADESNIADRLEVDAARIKGLGLRFGAATEATEYLLAILPGVIAPPPNARVAVAATFPGTVIQTMVAEGDYVRRGQVLAVVASREILTLAAGFAQAKARLAVAQSNAARQKQLALEGIVAGARAEEADSELAQARAEVEEKSRILAAVNADGAKGTYSLTAPMDGMVARAQIQAGEPIEGMVAPYVVDAVDRYEVQAQIPERLVGKIAAGMRVDIGGGIKARVTSAGTAIQPDTRSATLKATIAPGSGVVAGRTIMASVFVPAPAGAVAVPRAAITDIGGVAVVFGQVDGGLSVRKVTTVGMVGDQAVVIAGLKRGEQVAISGLSELKSLALTK